MRRLLVWFTARPDLSTGVILCLVLLAVFAWAVRNAGLSTWQWLGLAIVCVALGAACAWILSWEFSSGTRPSHHERGGRSDRA